MIEESAALGPDRSDVLALGDRGHRLLRHRTFPRDRCSTSAWAPPTATPSVGSVRTTSTRFARPKPTFGFGGGPHVCLGQHVARAEMTVAINELLDRLPNLRLDPDAEPPRFIGFYERGATAIPVRFD